MPVTTQQIADLKAAIVVKLKDFQAKYQCVAEMRSASSSRHLIVETAFDGVWHPAAILDLDTGHFLKGSFRKGKVKVAARQPKAPPTITAYALNAFGDIKGITSNRIFIIGASVRPGGEIRPFAN